METSNQNIIKNALESLLESSPIDEVKNDVAVVLDDLGLAATILQLLEQKLLARFGLTDSAALKAYLTDSAAKAAEEETAGLESLKLAQLAGSKG